MNSAKRNWKTTITGIIMLALAAVGVWHNPASVSDPNVIATIAGGVGLIAAKDGNVSGTADQKTGEEEAAE